MADLSKEMQAFIRGCEYVLSPTLSSPLSDDDRRIVEYYIEDLSNKYGAPMKVTPIRRSRLTLVTKASPGSPRSPDIPLAILASDRHTEQL